VSLAEPKDLIHFRSKVEAMEQSADQQWDFNAFVMSAKGETSTKSSSTTEHTGGNKVAVAPPRNGSLPSWGLLPPLFPCFPRLPW